MTREIVAVRLEFPDEATPDPTGIWHKGYETGLFDGQYVTDCGAVLSPKPKNPLQTLSLAAFEATPAGSPFRDRCDRCWRTLEPA